jgi:hypothetical protein
MLQTLALLLLFSGIYAEQGPNDREALRGIKRIGVQIGEISPAAKAVGVERKYLRRNIELKLQSKGITVVGNKERESNTAIPYLLVTVLLSYSEPTYSYVVMLGLNEKVHLARDPKMTPNAMPWWRIIKGEHFGNTGLLKEIDKTLAQLLDEFCEDYFAVNSPRATTQSGTR